MGRGRKVGQLALRKVTLLKNIIKEIKISPKNGEWDLLELKIQLTFRVQSGAFLVCIVWS